METVRRIAGVVQALVTEWADEVDEQTHVIRRKRKFSAATLARTFVFGFLARPRATDEDLAKMAAVVGVSVSTQAIEQRYSRRLVEFLEALFRKGVTALVQAPKCVPGVLERFVDVLLLDSTTISLPLELADQFPGCGGSHGGTAAMKLQVQTSLVTGALDAVRIEPGKSPDRATALQSETPKPGTLRIADLGYFDTSVFARYEQAGAYWLSPLLYPTTVADPKTGKTVDLLPWLSSRGPVVDERILLGGDQRVPCRLIAWRLPEEVANRRRQKLEKKARKKGRPAPSKKRLAWCDWGLLVTNVPQEKLSIDEARVLYRSRWQIELLFKRWKSQGEVAAMSGTTVIRSQVHLWSRLLSVLVQHWLLLCTAWGDFRLSLVKVWETIRQFGLTLASSLTSASALATTITLLEQILQATSRRNKRKRPSTFELLMDPTKLEYGLT